MGAIRAILRFVMKVCAFFFALGLLCLVLAAANEVFGMGVFRRGLKPTEDEAFLSTLRAKQAESWTSGLPTPGGASWFW